MVSFMLSLSCTDTISIIKKLSRTNTIGHSYVNVRKAFNSLFLSDKHLC